MVQEKHNMTFLPDTYKIPVAEGGYYRFQQGENKFRIMSSPILGYEYWTEEDGKRKPNRLRMEQQFSSEDIAPASVEDVKHFWAMVVWNYDAKRLQILEITQKSIMKAIRALTKSEDWGDPKGTKGYDILITREGEGMETEYSTQPGKPKELDKAIVKAYKEANIKLEALFDNEDPFEVDVDEI